MCVCAAHKWNCNSILINAVIDSLEISIFNIIKIQNHSANVNSNEMTNIQREKNELSCQLISD